MRPAPQNRLNPKVKNVWRISAALWIVLYLLVCFLPMIIGYCSTDIHGLFIGAVVVLVIGIVGIVIFCGVFPNLRYIRWRYELSDDFLDIQKGIIWRNRVIVPFIRVQNTDTSQGPLLRAFGLASVTISTAAGEHVIPGLTVEDAVELRDRAAELARIAQEDV